jgi:hypothetical protein
MNRRQMLAGLSSSVLVIGFDPSRNAFTESAFGWHWVRVRALCSGLS